MTNTLRLLLAVLTLAALAGTAAHAQTPAFDRAIACASGDDYYAWGPRTIAVDAQGNTYVSGTFNGTVVLGNTLLTATQAAPNMLFASDVFVAKLDAAGNYLWAVQLGDGQALSLSALAVDAAGDVYAVGSFSSYSVRFGAGGPVLYNSSAQGEAFVAKLSGTTRQWLWARRAGGTGYDSANILALNAAGEVYLTGTLESNVADFGSFTLTAPSPSIGTVVGAFIAKLSPAGAWLWARPVSQGKEINIATLVVAPQGGIYLGGYFESASVSFGTTTLETQRITGSPGLYGSDVFIAKTNDAGTWLWAVQGDAVTHQNLLGAGRMAYDGVGHFYVAGSYRSTSARVGSTVLPNRSAMAPQPNPLPPQPYTNNYYTDAFVARFDATTQTWDWAVRNGGPDYEGAALPVVDAQGRVYVIGSFDSPATVAGYSHLAQLDAATGAWRSIQPLAPVGVQDMVLDGQSRLNLAGFLVGASATFGATTLTQDGPERGLGYIARLGAGPLAAHAPVPRPEALRVWPNPNAHVVVWIEGPAAGQPVQVLDVLGRTIATGQMPPGGPLALPLPPTAAAGLYVVRAAGQARPLVVE